nr:9788_t:CDS:2 [Entrophospora candida]
MKNLLWLLIDSKNRNFLKKPTPNDNNDNSIDDSNLQSEKYEKHPQAYHTSRRLSVINNNSNSSYGTSVYDPSIPLIFEQNIENVIVSNELER